MTLESGVANENVYAGQKVIRGDGSQTVNVELVTHPSDGNVNYQRGSSFTFEKVTINIGKGGNWDGIVCNSQTFKDCTIQGNLTTYGEARFKNCTFIPKGKQYSLWTYDSEHVVVDDCAFQSANGKAIKVYGAPAVQNTINVTVNNCKFTNTGTPNKAAIETADGEGKSYNVIINHITVTGFKEGQNTSDVKWSNASLLSTDRLSVTIDGVKVY